jgi:glutaredoxin
VRESVVETLEHLILASFEERGTNGLSREELLAGVMSEPRTTKEEAEANAAIERLEREGMLESTAEGLLRRTEDGRVEIAGTRDATLYSRPGCHLCEEAKAVIAPLVARAGGRFHEVNVDENEKLKQEYGLDVPVLLLGKEEVARHRVTTEMVKLALRKTK